MIIIHPLIYSLLPAIFPIRRQWIIFMKNNKFFHIIFIVVNLALTGQFIIVSF